MPNEILIEVAYALPKKQLIIPVKVKQGITAKEAIQLSGIVKKFPEIDWIKKSLYKNGAVYASMSGSGSSVFGLFKANEIPNFNFPSNYLVFSTLL